MSLPANPPFNDSDWFRKDDDVRWQFGVPPKGNANFAWVQHFVAELHAQFAESAKLEAQIKRNLEGLGYAL